jgi:predicted HTH transcriptional regulator
LHHPGRAHAGPKANQAAIILEGFGHQDPNPAGRFSKRKRRIEIQYAGDLEAFGKKATKRRAANRQKALDAMKPGEWIATPGLAEIIKMATSTVQGRLKDLIADGKAKDNGKDGKYRRYQRIADLETGDSIGDSAIGDK